MLLIKTLWFCISTVVFLGPVSSPPTAAFEVEDGERSEIRLPVTLEADQHTELRARIEGYVSQVMVDIGDRVTAGQVLVLLDAPELEAEVARKQQIVRKAEANLRVMRSAVEKADAHLEQAKSALAEQTALKKLRTTQRDRFLRLVESGAVDRDKLDEANYALLAVEAASKKIEADIAAAKADVNAARSEVDFAESGIEVANADLKYTPARDDLRSISSPFAGIVTGRHVDPGTLVSPGRGTTMPLLIVESISVLRGVVTVPAENAQSISVGDRVAFHGIHHGQVLEGVDGEPAQVSRISQTLEMKTRTMRVEIDVVNPLDVTSGRYELLSGQYGTVSIMTE